MSAHLLDNPFWQFALRCYSRPGNAAFCLKLQDEYRVNVNVLLFSAWLAQSDRSLPRRDWNALTQQLQPWQQRTEQIRVLRRALKPFNHRAEGNNLYKAVKRLELISEQYQQYLMWRAAAYSKTGGDAWQCLIEDYNIGQFKRELLKLQ